MAKKRKPRGSSRKAMTPLQGSLTSQRPEGERLTSAEYRKAFWRREKNALEHALETRKFEIELYWKRAAYFWTFIAAALAAYGVIQASKDILSPKREHLSVFVGVLGLVFSFAWRAVNRGSKHWQENWENHVALLENEVIGPLYKTVSERPREVGHLKRMEGFLTGPFKYSVSKVNQLVSLFVLCVWPLLIWEALPPFDRTRPPDLFLILVTALGGSACLIIWRLGRSHSFNHEPVVRLYTSVIKDDASSEAQSNAINDSP